MEDWLHLINAETEGELMTIQQTTAIPEVKDTIVMLRRLSADEKVRQEAYYREKRLHDEASVLGSARREGIAIGLEQGRAEGEAKGRVEGASALKEKLMQKWRAAGMTEQQIQYLLEE